MLNTTIISQEPDADELQLLYIYDKADFENVSDSYLRDILKRMN